MSSWRKLMTFGSSVCLLAACGGGGGGGQAPLPVSLSGSVLAVANSDIDSDLNDTLSPFTPNDGFDSAQLIANLAMLGGYLNQPGAGSPGRSQSSGDLADYYQVDLEAGQSIVVLMAEAVDVNNNPNDIDLTLFDVNQMVVDQSLGNSITECVETTLAGTYFVRANIEQGATNYTLSITSLPCSVTAAGADLRLASEFKPGEMVVRWREPGAARAMRAAMQASGMRIEEMPHKRYARVYIDDMDQLRQRPAAVVADDAMSAAMSLKADTLGAIKMMRAYPGVEYVEPNYIYRPSLTPNDPRFPLQWHHRLINLPEAWDQAAGGSGAIVAVLDTGVRVAHPDLQNNLLPGYDFISDPVIANDGNGRDNNPDDPGDGLTPGLSSFHGTHVSGIVAAEGNNAIGVSGAAFYPNIRVMPLRVLGVGGGLETDICEALRYAARLPNASGVLPAEAADVVNMSFNGSVFSQFLQDCVNNARNQGLIIVAAAGNGATSAPFYPAAYNGVVSVGAVDLVKNLAQYSNFGSTIDVVAPGGDSRDDNGDGLIDAVHSTIAVASGGGIVDTYGNLIGTSMASPHVAAVAALMKSVSPALTPAMFDSLLASGLLSDDLGAAGRDDRFGHGLINANKAVLRALGLTPTTPLPSAAPSGINFGLVQSSAEFNVSNAGGGSLQVTAVSDNSGGWLSVSVPGGDGLGSYVVTADRNHAALANPGSYSATISLTSNAGVLSLPVLLQVAQTGQSLSANAGLQNILLLSLNDAANNQLISLQAVNGAYQFRFENVAVDDYLIFAGTDNDNDLSICDAGEACGLLGSLAEPLSVAEGDAGVIDVGGFFSGFGLGFGLATTTNRDIRLSAPVPLPRVAAD